MHTSRSERVTAWRGPRPTLPRLEERFPALLGAPPEAARSIRRLRLAFISAGSVASRAAEHMARMQVASLMLVDPSRFKPESLLTYGIPPEALGHFKAEWFAERCRRIGAARVTAHVCRVQDLRPSLLVDCDLVALASDNLRCEIDAGELCRRMGKPLAHAAVHPETLSAQVRFYGNARPESPCPGCGYSRQEWEQFADEVVHSCQGLSTTVGRPTMSAPFLCSLAADLLCVQILRWALRLGPSVEDALVSYCGYTHRVLQSPLAPNPHCRCDHLRWDVAGLAMPLAGATVDDLVAAAGGCGHGDRGDFLLHVEGHKFVAAACCCGRKQLFGRFVGAADQAPAVPCAVCGRPLTAPIERREAPLESLPRGRTLGELGVAGRGGALLTCGRRTTLLYQAGANPLDP